MKILVDADACPVKDIIIRLAKEYSIEVIMFVDTSHILYDGYSKVITVDKGRDSVDFALVNVATNGDIVVTQDYGLAAMALSKNCHALNQNGLIFTNDNINTLLSQRHLFQKQRNARIKTPNPKKRSKEDDSNFETSFKTLIISLIN